MAGQDLILLFWTSLYVRSTRTYLQTRTVLGRHRDAIADEGCLRWRHQRRCDPGRCRSASLLSGWMKTLDISRPSMTDWWSQND